MNQSLGPREIPVQSTGDVFDFTSWNSELFHIEILLPVGL